MSRGFLLPVFAAFAFAIPLRAEQYWVTWDGNDYPENEGWERIHYGDDGPAADRSLADGIMTLDGLASIEIIDAYRLNRPLNPEPGEEFIVQWGLQVNQVGNPIYPFDPGWELTSDDGWHVSLVFGVGEAHSIPEQDNFSFEPNVFHGWEFRSFDMRSYVILMDGSIIHTGTFREIGVLESRVEWGDLVYGANSHSNWDYFRFGVVPEPESCISLLALLCGARASYLASRS